MTPDDIEKLLALATKYRVDELTLSTAGASVVIKKTRHAPTEAIKTRTGEEPVPPGEPGDDVLYWSSRG